MAKTISMKAFEALLARMGIKMAPHDHPIYSEGSSITFLNHAPNVLQPKVLVAGPTGSVLPTGPDQTK